MELVKNIFFNTDKLTANSLVKISYTGKFFQDNSEKVYIHYGFKNDKEQWDNNDCQNYIFNIEHPDLSLILSDYILPSPRKLRKSYLINKKIRIAIYKMLIYIPKLITGNYKRKQKNMI